MKKIRIDWFNQDSRIGTPGEAEFVNPQEAQRKVIQLKEVSTIISINIDYVTGRQQWSREVGGTWNQDYSYDSARDNVAQPA
jgi:hypothetical protein